MPNHHESGYLFSDMDPSRRFPGGPNGSDGHSRPSRRESRITDDNEGDPWHIRVDEEAISRPQRVKVKTERVHEDPVDRACAEVEAELGGKLKAQERNDLQFAVLQAGRFDQCRGNAKMTDFYRKDTAKFFRSIESLRPQVQTKIREVLRPYVE